MPAPSGSAWGVVPGLTPDALPDGLVVADDRGRLLLVNAAARRLTGLTTEDVGRPLSEALPLEDARGRRWWGCADPYGGLPTRNGHPERALTLPDGRAVLVTARYVRERPLGPVCRVVVALRGTRSWEREDRSRAELVSTVAHELRSPLTSVKGFTATLLAKWDRFSDAQKRLMLETVDADADRLTRLITDLLDIARIDAGRLTVRRELVDAAAVARHVVAGSVAGGVAAGRFTVEVAPVLPELWADADKIEQVVTNLVDNAVRHGAGTIAVRVGAEAGGATVISVADEGSGVAADLRQRVFTKFWHGGRRGGTGLGLYISRGLVEAHGGTVEIGDGPAGGAVFTVSLPAGTPEFAR